MSKAAYAVIIALLLMFAVFISVEPYKDCRAAGHSVSKCVMTVKYWSAKRFWGF